MVSISDYLDKDLILFLEAKTRNEVLSQMVERIDQKRNLPDKELFHTAIMEREKIVSTGIGMGVAIPHAKLPNYDDFFIAIALLQDAVEWHSIDSNPVKLVFMIGGPDDKQTEYLQILSNITVSIKDEERRTHLQTASTPEEILQQLKNF